MMKLRQVEKSAGRSMQQIAATPVNAVSLLKTKTTDWLVFVKTAGFWLDKQQVYYLFAIIYI